MTSLPSDRPVSALRERMIEDMNVRGFSEKTRNDYIRNVRAFAAFIGRGHQGRARRSCLRLTVWRIPVTATPVGC